MAYTITNGLCTLVDVKEALRISDTNDDDRLSLAIDAASRLIEGACNRRFWQDPVSRVDNGCTLSTNSSTVLDSNIVATDAGRQVLGSVPTGTIVGDVNPGTSFTLINFEGAAQLPTASGSQSLTIGLTPRRFVSNDYQLVEVDDISTIDGMSVMSDYIGDGSFSTVWAVQDYQLEPVNGIMQGQAGWPFTKIRAIRSLYFPVWGGIAYPKPYTQALIEVVARWGWSAVPADVHQAAIIQSISVFKAVDVPFGATPFGESGTIRLKDALHPTAERLLRRYLEDEVMVA